MELVFAASLFLVFHAYFGYPLTLLLFRRNPATKAPFEPHITLIITACNEERRIRFKLENTLVLDYPRNRLQVLVASDGSTDGTDEIVRSYAAHGIELLAFTERRGKESAQKDAVLRASGEVIVFSDVATRIDPHGLKEIIEKRLMVVMINLSESDDPYLIFESLNFKAVAKAQKGRAADMDLVMAKLVEVHKAETPAA